MDLSRYIAGSWERKVLKETRERLWVSIMVPLPKHLGAVRDELLKSALVKKIIDRPRDASGETSQATDQTSSPQVKFALKCFNALAQDGEISSVQVASSVLQLNLAIYFKQSIKTRNLKIAIFSFFTKSKKFYRLNLWSVRAHVKNVISSEEVGPMKKE